MENLQGRLLIAGGGLIDPNFRQTVVLVAEHNDEGALGVVLNRPAPVTVADAVPLMAESLPPDEPLFFGGPVETQAGVVLAEFEHPEIAGRLVTGSIGFLTGDIERDALEGVRRARVFAGYAGWGPGQLEDEIGQSAWIVELPSPDDVFTNAPDLLWRTILKRKGGGFAILSLMPVDPSAN